MSKCGSKCAVNGCDNYKNQKNARSFFRLPKAKDILIKWIEACNTDKLKHLFETKEPDYFYGSYVVCSDHFEEKCFRNKNLHSQGLFRGSIPTINIYDASKPLKRENEEDLSSHIPFKEIKTEDQDQFSVSMSSLNGKLEQSKPSTKDVLVQTEKQVIAVENAVLKSRIVEYQKKLRNKNSLLCKYRKKNAILKQRLRQYKDKKIK